VCYLILLDCGLALSDLPPPEPPGAPFVGGLVSTSTSTTMLDVIVEKTEFDPGFPPGPPPPVDVTPGPPPPTVIGYDVIETGNPAGRI
jgi:hypothetical protein